MNELIDTRAPGESLPRRFVFFVATRFAPLKYLPYCALWVGSLQLMASRAYPNESQLSLVAYLCSTASAFVLLLFLRVVDEIKDLEHDRVHNPERAFASGRVPVSDASFYLVFCSFAASVLQRGHLLLLGAASAVMSYSLLLLYLDRAFPRFAASMFPNIALAIQLKTLLSVFVLLNVLEGAADQWSTWLPVVVAHVAAYLHWEILRKIQWPAATLPGERLYSNELGVSGSLLIASACLIAALCLVRWMLAPSAYSALLVLPAVPLSVAVWTLFRSRAQRVRIGGLGLLGYLSFLIVNIVCSL